MAIAIAMLLGHSVTAQAPSCAPLARMAGCYHLTLGAWSKASSLGPAQATTVVRLDTVPRLPGTPGDLVAQRIEPAQGALPGDVRARWLRPAFWRRAGGDSVIIIMWGTGTEAEAFYGKWKSDGLHGVVRRTSDAIPVDPVTREVQWDAWPWAPASAVSSPCP